MSISAQTSTKATLAPSLEARGGAKRMVACIDDGAAGAMIMHWLLALPISPSREAKLSAKCNDVSPYCPPARPLVALMADISSIPVVILKQPAIQ